MTALPSALDQRIAATARQVAGRPCLDFANLVGGWEDATHARDDRLTDYADLLAWSWKAGLLDAVGATRLWRASRGRPDEAASVLSRARRLRDAVHGVAWALERDLPEARADLDAMAEEARLARARQHLARSPAGIEWRFADDRNALDAPLWPVALSAEAYFTGADLSRLHSCPGETCGWHFEDATRNRSRQWCAMGDCGNLAKVRRFRERQQRARRTPARLRRP